MPLIRSPSMPGGIVDIGMAKYDASCVFFTCGKTAGRSGVVIRATLELRY